MTAGSVSYLWSVYALTRPSLALATLLAALLLALAAPAEAGPRTAHSSCCGDHCPARADACPMMDAAMAGVSDATLSPTPDGSCCVFAPAIPHAAALAPAAPQTRQALAAVVLARAVERPALRATVRPLDAGPPPLGRRHLALSVLQI